MGENDGQGLPCGLRGLSEDDACVNRGAGNSHRDMIQVSANLFDSRRGCVGHKVLDFFEYETRLALLHSPAFIKCLVEDDRRLLNFLSTSKRIIRRISKKVLVSLRLSQRRECFHRSNVTVIEMANDRNSILDTERPGFLCGFQSCHNGLVMSLHEGNHSVGSTSTIVYCATVVAAVEDADCRIDGYSEFSA